MPIQIAQLLQPQHIKLTLQSTKRTGAIHEITRLLEGHTDIENLQGFYEEVLERERVEPTCLGSGIAFPHARTDHIRHMVLAVGRSVPGILFENANQNIQLIFVIGTPKKLATDYLALVGALARILKEISVREKLLATTTPEEFCAILAEAEQRMLAGI